jgi:hypothetical protein
LGCGGAALFFHRFLFSNICGGELRAGPLPEDLMRRLIYAFFILAVWSGPFAFGQVSSIGPNSGPIQTGFAVVTPLAGNGQGLSVVETFGLNAGGNVFQSSVLPSPLVTLSNVFVSWDGGTGVDTGIAIVNPNSTGATITLNLLDEQGALTATRTLAIGERQQVAVFATELFQGIPELSRPFAGLLFIAADVPVGVLALAFIGPSFSSLPVSVQLSEGNVVAAGTFTATPGSLVPAPAPVTNTVAPPTVPVSSVPPPTPPTFGSATEPTAADLTVPTAQFATPSSITELIEATGGFLLPQVASGGGWVSQIMIGNVSAEAQIVRVDFFDSSGAPMLLPSGSTIPSLVVPAGGVIVLSTAM